MQKQKRNNTIGFDFISCYNYIIYRNLFDQFPMNSNYFTYNNNNRKFFYINLLRKDYIYLKTMKYNLFSSKKNYF